MRGIGAIRAIGLPLRGGDASRDGRSTQPGWAVIAFEHVSHQRDRAECSPPLLAETRPSDRLLQSDPRFVSRQTFYLHDM